MGFCLTWKWWKVSLLGVELGGLEGLFLPKQTILWRHKELCLFVPAKSVCKQMTCVCRHLHSRCKCHRDELFCRQNVIVTRTSNSELVWCWLWLELVGCSALKDLYFFLWNSFWFVRERHRAQVTLKWVLKFVTSYELEDWTLVVPLTTSVVLFTAFFLTSLFKNFWGGSARVGLIQPCLN